VSVGKIGSAVVFESVGKRYGKADALTDFSLSVAPGEFVTLLGPSGSGKTTALNILAGFVDPTSGDVKVGGQSVIGLPPERRNLGMVFQHYSLFPHMTVAENVAFPLKLRKVPKAEIADRVARMLDMVKLTGHESRRPGELSGGQRQRVAFARAVVFEPPVLLMDEPLGALDLKLRQAMQYEIKRYHTELNCTIIMVTHDQGEALGLSDRVAVLGDGKIIQIDTPYNIYDLPKSRYVADFVGNTNIMQYNFIDGRIFIEDIGASFVDEGLSAQWESGYRMISVRPEMIQRSGISERRSISFEANIDGVIFLGNVVQYSAITSSGRNIFFQEHRGPDVNQLGRGDRVRLSFALADARAVLS